MASAITDKGIETASDATFETMANNINTIKSYELAYATGISWSYTRGTWASISITFPKAFSKIPLVGVSGLTRLSIEGISVTTTGITISIYNHTSGTLSGAYSWVAVVI